MVRRSGDNDHVCALNIEKLYLSYVSDQCLSSCFACSALECIRHCSRIAMITLVSDDNFHGFYYPFININLSAPTKSIVLVFCGFLSRHDAVSRGKQFIRALKLGQNEAHKWRAKSRERN